MVGHAGRGRQLRGGGDNGEGRLRLYDGCGKRRAIARTRLEGGTRHEERDSRNETRACEITVDYLFENSVPVPGRSVRVASDQMTDDYHFAFGASDGATD